jgi:hypothetical protein
MSDPAALGDTVITIQKEVVLACGEIKYEISVFVRKNRLHVWIGPEFAPLIGINRNVA